jgi:hypothetical protein
MNCDRSVGIETDYVPDGRSSIPDDDRRFFRTPQRPVCLWSQSALSQWVPWPLSQEVKQPGCGADHSTPSNAEVKIDGAITFTLLYVFMI